MLSCVVQTVVATDDEPVQLFSFTDATSMSWDLTSTSVDVTYKLWLTDDWLRWDMASYSETEEEADAWAPSISVASCVQSYADSSQTSQRTFANLDPSHRYSLTAEFSVSSQFGGGTISGETALRMPQ